MECRERVVVKAMTLLCLSPNENFLFLNTRGITSEDVHSPYIILGLHLPNLLFVSLDQRSENESSGSNHFEITKEITEFIPSGSLRSLHLWRMPEMVASRALVFPTAG